MTTTYALFTPSESPLAAVDSPQAREGKTVRRFRKDIARVGTYTHPREKWRLDITPERMGKWVDSFRKMKANGVPCEVNVDHSIKAEDARGQVVDMFIEGDRLIGIHELVGDESIKLAERVHNVSPYIELDYTDGKGNKYGEAITHSAIVQQPVIPGQMPFEALAASIGASGVQALQFSNGDTMKLDELRKLVGAGAEVTDEALQAMVADAIRKAKTAQTEAERTATGKQAEIDQLKARIAELEAKGQKAAPDDDTLGMLAEGAETALESLVEMGHVTPAVAASIRKEFVGEAGKRNAYALSAAYSGRPVSIAKTIIDILKQNKPVDMKVRTGVQTLAMSVHGDDVDAETQKKNEAEAAKHLRAGAGIKD